MASAPAPEMPLVTRQRKRDPNARDRIRRLLVTVNQEERIELQRRAEVAGMSLSGYLRTAGLNHPIRSTLDYDAVRDLVGVAGDLGRLASQFRLWLAEPRTNAAEVRQALKDTQALQERVHVQLDRVSLRGVRR